MAQFKTFLAHGNLVSFLRFSIFKPFYQFRKLCYEDYHMRQSTFLNISDEF